MQKRAPGSAASSNAGSLICSALPLPSRRSRRSKTATGAGLSASTAKPPGSAMRCGTAPHWTAAKRIVALMRLTIEDTRLVDERVGQRPVYLILAMGADKVVRLKPQNLVAGL